MKESRGIPSEPVAASSPFRWRNILLVIAAMALLIFGFASMAGGERGVWGASHTPGRHR